MKKFNLYWLDGTIETVTGSDILNAVTMADYSRGAMNSLDCWEEAKEVPLKYKEVILIKGDSRKELGKANNNTLFIRQLVDQIESGKQGIFITVMGTQWVCAIEITVFEILCRCLNMRHRDGSLDKYEYCIL